MSKYKPDEYGCHFIGKTIPHGCNWYCVSLTATCAECEAQNIPVFNGAKTPTELVRSPGGWFCRDCQLSLNNNGLEPAIIAFFVEMFGEDPSKLLEL